MYKSFSNITDAHIVIPSRFLSELLGADDGLVVVGVGFHTALERGGDLGALLEEVLVVALGLLDAILPPMNSSLHPPPFIKRQNPHSPSSSSPASASASAPGDTEPG